MSIDHATRTSAKTGRNAHQLPARLTGGVAESSVITGWAAKALAVTRVVVGFVFLWAFLDKLFGLHYSTPGSKAWIHGGSPTKGFLGSVDVGPFQSTFHSMAGTVWADWLFMLALAGIGIALIAGVAMRITAISSTVLLLMMWAAEWPLAQHTSAGAPSTSSNPLIDYHIVYALVIIALTLVYAGNTWSLGKFWNNLPIVRDSAWLR